MPDVSIERVGDDYRVSLRVRVRRLRADWVSQPLRRVAQSLVEFQREFLDLGLPFLRPLTLREVAADIDMHESSVSRAITNKYVQTPRGVFALKFFFHGGIETTEGATVSSVSVKTIIRDIVDAEEPIAVVSDQDITRVLHSHGLTIARRTVAKYRAELGIPSSYRRQRQARRRLLARVGARARSASRDLVDVTHEDRRPRREHARQGLDTTPPSLQIVGSVPAPAHRMDKGSSFGALGTGAPLVRQCRDHLGEFQANTGASGATPDPHGPRRLAHFRDQVRNSLAAAPAARRGLYHALVRRFGVVILGRHLARIDAILDRAEAAAATHEHLRPFRSDAPRHPLDDVGCPVMAGVLTEEAVRSRLAYRTWPRCPIVPIR